jgi:hypothetical protein
MKLSEVYRKIPSSLSINVLKRIMDDKEIYDLIDRYIEERNKSYKLKVIHCPNCGHKLDYKRKI